jgi:hypothetical protein
MTTVVQLATMIYQRRMGDLVQPAPILWGAIIATSVLGEEDEEDDL